MKINSKNLHKLTKESNLFYEIGRYIKITGHAHIDFLESNWQRLGIFKKIEDVPRFKKLLEKELEHQGAESFDRYCIHHNFHTEENG